MGGRVAFGGGHDGQMNYLVDPDNITDFGLSDDGLELVLLFWICAAGKKASLAAANLCRLLEDGRVRFGEDSPFSIVLSFGQGLAAALRSHGIGCYNNKSRSMLELASSGIDLRSCTVAELESVRGIGPKTARCFLIHSRRGVRHAGLDTHVLKYMRAKGIDVPKSTPSGRRYLELEEMFLGMADCSGKSVAEFDLEIWKSYSSGVVRKR
jgi:thermostable 8-oxoguanine DNA glycosylase